MNSARDESSVRVPRYKSVRRVSLSTCVGRAGAAELYEVATVPTILVVDTFGIVKLRKSGALVGARGVEELLGLLAKARDSAGDEKAIRQKVRTRPDVVTRLEAANWFLAHGFANEAMPILDAVSVDKTATNTQRVAAVRTAAERRRTHAWKAQLVAEKSAIIMASPADALDDDVCLPSARGRKQIRDRAHVDRRCWRHCQ